MLDWSSCSFSLGWAHHCAALKRERPFDVPADTRRVLTGTGRMGLRGAHGEPPPDLMERLVQLAKYGVRNNDDPRKRWREFIHSGARFGRR